MTDPVDRLLTLLGDEVTRICLRMLLERPRSQSELAKDAGIAQSATSRATGLLRAAGWVEADGLRGASLHVSAPESTRQLFLSADHVADELLQTALVAQSTRTRQDRSRLLGEPDNREEDAS